MTSSASEHEWEGPDPMAAWDKLLSTMGEEKSSDDLRNLPNWKEVSLRCLSCLCFCCLKNFFETNVTFWKRGKVLKNNEQQ